MKILGVRANNHKKAFEVRTHRETWPFPYALADPSPTSGDRIVHVYVDKELGREAVTYELESGLEGSIHIDSVLEHNKDPGHLADLMLYRLTAEAQRRIKRSRLSMREVCRRIGTSASQLYRLLDPTNTKKSLRQMLALLFVLGCDVDLVVRRRKTA